MTGPRPADAPGEGGEPPCFMERVCPRCGAYVPSLRCPVCGHEAGDEVTESGPAPAD